MIESERTGARESAPGSMQSPRVHSTATIMDSELGAWTEVGERASLVETVLGDYSYVERDTQVIYTHIGKFCSIASGVRINPGNHPLGRAALHHFTYRSRGYCLSGSDDEAFFQWRRSHPVRLGHDVWIGHGAVVLPGRKIGTGAAVGAGTVVTHDVPPFTIVAGVPGTPVRERFPRRVQKGLLRIAWWDWSWEQLRRALEDFQTLEAEAFVEKYDTAPKIAGAGGETRE
ncbi:MAG: acetyltransferase [Desulfobacteraceae bacterium]